MSGGSYDYLSSWKPLDEQRGQIEAMARGLSFASKRHVWAFWVHIGR